MKLSVIIPVYNEETTIVEVIKRVSDVNLGCGLKKEIIVVDDGSTDGTFAKLRECEGMVDCIHRFPINQGKGTAVRTGIQLAGGDIIVIQDADLELNPAEYPHLLNPIISGEAKVVYGSRLLRRNRFPLRTALANRMLTWLTNRLYGAHLTDMETGYKVFRANVLRSFPLESKRFEFEPEVTAKLLRRGYQIQEVPVTYSPRTGVGKKIRFRDGIKAIGTLFKYRNWN